MKRSARTERGRFEVDLDERGWAGAESALGVAPGDSDLHEARPPPDLRGADLTSCGEHTEQQLAEQCALEARRSQDRNVGTGPSRPKRGQRGDESWVHLEKGLGTRSFERDGGGPRCGRVPARPPSVI